MYLVVLNRKKMLIILSFLLMLLVTLILFQKLTFHSQTIMVMGGRLYKQPAIKYSSNSITKNEDVETYFRPSDLPVLNNRFTFQFFHDYLVKNDSELSLPDYLLKTPEETILNYYSILREASNAVNDKLIGCGTIGDSTIPYPFAYQFLSTSYQKKLSFQQYLDTFKNILHISLIKYRKISVYDNPAAIRYFIEIETIQGCENGIGNFAYYYGFIDLLEENGLYKISNLEYYGENYLCAPYHGWWYDAESSVQIRYGGWCSLIEEMNPTVQDGYVKNISFHGTDGYDYLIVFYRLTNDNDIEIAQYRKDKSGGWKLIKFNPQNCIKENSK